MRGPLPNDVTRCVNATCPLKNKCLRWLERTNSASLLSYAYFECEEIYCSNMISRGEWVNCIYTSESPLGDGISVNVDYNDTPVSWSVSRSECYEAPEVCNEGHNLDKVYLSEDVEWSKANYFNIVGED